MTFARRSRWLVLALALCVPALARAEAPTKELRVPPAPSQEITESLAAMRKALPDDLHAAFAVVVADAHVRLRASAKQDLEANSERLSIREACKAALFAADFAGVSQRKAKVVDALVAVTALQLTVDLHTALRERSGRQLAIRSIRACAGDIACIDAIAPTAAMEARHIASVRAAYSGDAQLATAEQLGEIEVGQLGTIYKETAKSTSKIMANAHEMKKALIANFPR
jgi:hypothetical protein